jgi:hypothetical protein
MTEIDLILERLAQLGPMAYRALDPTEQAWRGRYLLMVAAIGASPVFAWANALARDVDGSAAAMMQLVERTTDKMIAGAIANSRLSIDDFVVDSP